MSSKWVKLGDVVDVIRGASPRPKGDPRYFGGDIPWIMIADVTKQPGKYLSKTREGVTPEGAKKSRLLKAGTLILSNSGTVCVPMILAVDGCIHDGFVAFPDLPVTIDKNYLYHYFNFIRPRIIQENKQGITQVNLNTNIVKDIDFPLRPLVDQQKIVSEIETQLSRLDEAVTALKRIQANLTRYKAAVLKAAVEGKLTEQWRKEHADVEPADRLLKRILAERRAKWEAEELAKMKAKGRVGAHGMRPDDSWKKKYKEPAGPDTVNLPELPEGWVWASVEQLSWKVQYGSSSKTSEAIQAVPVLRMGNIFEGALRLDELKYLPSKHDEFPELLLDDDDLLFNRTNSPELVGKTAVYSGHPSPCSFASYLIRVKFVDSVKSRYVSHYINSIYGRNWIASVVSQQVGQANVNGTKLQGLAVPLPSFVEQRVVLAEIDRRLSVTEELEATIDTNLRRAERLRQTILGNAFSLSRYLTSCLESNNAN